MKTILKYVVASAVGLLLSTSSLFAGTATVDLSIALSIPQSVVEAGQPYINNITIKNENANVNASGAKITYQLLQNSTYNSYTGSGWNCTHDSAKVICTYNTTLDNNQTSNPLFLKINAPNVVTTLDVNSTVNLSGTTDPVSGNDTAYASIPTGKSNLTATKTVSKTAIAVGEAFTYTITAKNIQNGSNTTVPVRNLNITDNIPTNFTFVSFATNDLNCSNSGNNITCNMASLAVGATKTVDINMTGTPGGTGIVNTATIDAASNNYNTVPFDVSAPAVTAQLPDIEITQTLIGGLSGDTAAVNSNVAYRLHVTNIGATPAQNVTLTNKIPAGTTFVSASGPWSCSRTTNISCTLNDTNLTQNEAYDLDINVTMPNSVGSVHNDANISTTSTEKTPLTNNSSSLTTTIKGADLNIAKTPNLGSTDIGTNYTYTITTTNAGLVTASNIAVKDTLDPNMTYVSDTGGCSGVSVEDTDTLTCNKSNIAADANWTFTVTVTMPTNSLHDVTNSASVTTATGQENNISTTDTATTHITGPNLNITKDANVTDVGLGKTFSYDINVSNVNTAAAINADITDQLPADVSIISILSADGWTCPASVSAGSTFHCTKATVPGNSSSSITFEAQAPSATTGPEVNTATISHSLNANDGTDTASVNVTGVVLTIDKMATPIVEAGGLIDYNITATNASHADAQSLTLTDNLANLGTGYTINSIIDLDGWDCSGSTGTSVLSCTRATLLAEGASSTIHFNVNVPINAILGTKTNTASVTTTTIPTPDVNASADTIIQGAHLVVTKSGDTKGTANEPINFAITVLNDGSAEARDVNLSIDLNTNSAANFSSLETDCGTATYSSVAEPFTCNLGNFAGTNGSKTIHIRAISPNYDSTYSGHNINNSAVAVTSTAEDNTTNDHTTWSVPINGADLLVNKTPSSQNVAVGQTVTYTISLMNQGDANATGISLDDIVHSSTTPLVLSNLQAGTGWSCTTSSPSNFHCSYNSSVIKDQNIADIKVDARVPMGATINSQLSNDVNVSNDTAEVDYVNTNRRSSPVTVRGADVNITKIVDKSTVSLGEQVVFTITATNNDLADAQDVNVTDTLPDGFTSIATNCASPAISNQNVTCHLGTLTHNGGSASFTITANAPTTNGTFNNIATVTTSTPESDYTNNDDNVTVTVEGADLVMTKSDSADPVAVNSLYNYTLHVKNRGRSSAFGADINDTLPTGTSGVTFESVISTDTNWTCDTSALPRIHCYTTNPNLELPGTASGSAYDKNIITFKVRAPSNDTTVSNTAYVDTNTSEASKTNNHDTETTRVISVDLQAQKDVNGVNPWNTNPTYVGIGGNINYTLYVKNQEISNVDGTSTVNIPITDINVTDKLPTNITNISVGSINSKFTCNQITFTFVHTLICRLKSGESLTTQENWIPVATITAKATTSFHDTDASIKNTAHNWIINQYNAVTSQEVNSATLYNNAPGGNGYLETDTLIRGANMSIKKTGPASDIGANQAFSYNLAIKNWPRNPGSTTNDIPSTTATNIVVKDTLPADVNFTSASGTGWNCPNPTGQVLTCNYTANSGNMIASTTASNITVNVTALNSIATLSNEANVTNGTPELTSLLGDNNDSVTTNIIGTKIKVVKNGTTEAGMGDELTYHISVTNDSAVPAQHIIVYDQLHSGVSVDSNWSRDINTTDWDCVNHSASAEHNIICTSKVGDLAPGASVGLKLYTKAPNYTGTIVNRAIATSSTTGDNNATSDFPTLIKGANIDFANNPFVQSPSPVGAYYPIDYNVTIENKGDSQAQDINLTMQFPTGFSQEFNVTSTSSSDAWNCHFDDASVKLTCSLPTLAPNNKTSMVQIHALAPNANQTVTYDLNVTAKDGEGNTTSATLNPTPTLIKGSDLYIKKSAKDPDPLSDGLYHDNNITIGVGKQVDFNISVKNNNIGLAKDVTVTDTLAPEFISDYNYTIIQQNDWNCNITGKTLSCNRAELAANTTAPDIIVSAIVPNDLTPTSNTADINTSTVEVDNSNNNDSVDIKIEGATLNATLTPSKTQVAMGEVFTYILDINNTGRNDAIDVNITNSLDSDFTYLDFNGSSTYWSCAENNNTITCQQPLIGAYSGNGTLKLDIQAPANNIGIYPNAIDINSSSIGNPLHITSPDVRILGADVVVDINATPSEVLEDRNVTYVINVKDINISTAKNIVVKQTFSQSINALYIDNNGTANCNIVDANQSVECSIASLDYMQDKNITITATMPFTNSIIDPLTSTVDVNTTTIQEDITNDTNSVDVKVMPIMPVADYRFDECKWNGSNNEVIDSINGINGRGLNGADTINHRLVQDSDHFSTIWRVGKFDGNGSIEIPNNQKLQITGDQTMCAWVKPSNFYARENIIAKAYNGEGAITQEASTSNTTSLTYYYGTNDGHSSSYQGFGSNQAINLNEWNHICVVRDLKKMKLKWYINNIKTNETTANYPQATASSNDLKIGAGYVHNFKGLIDEVEIYNIALDNKAINDIYNFEKNHKNYDGSDRNQTYCGMNLEVLKTVSPTGNVGAESNLTYTIKVTNLAAEPLTEGFTLTDNLPAQVEYVSDGHSSNVNCTGTQNLSCTFPNTLALDINQFETFTINAKTINLDKVNTTNTASVASIQTDTDTSNNSSSVTNQVIGTDLKITKTATPALPTPNIPFIYTVRVENISTLADARGIVMKDKFDSRLVYSGISPSTNENNISITCAVPDANNVLSCDIPKLSQGNYVEFNVTMKSPTVEVNLLNEANVTSITKDTYLPNNETNITIDTNTTVSSININELHEKYFHKDASVNKYGNIATIGNTMLVAQGNTTGVRLNEINSTKQNSSSATLDVINTPNTSDDNITIEYAGLFWGGHIHGHDINETGNDIPFNEITFETPDGSTHLISADKNDTNQDSNASNRVGYYHFKKGDENNDTSQIGNYRIFYGAKADITNIIKNQNANGNLEGSYTVSNMQVTDGIDSYDWAPTTGSNWERFRDYGYFGGWSMVVIYSVNHRYHREVKFKNLSSFSGFRVLTPKSPGDPVVLNTTIDGFITPLHGNIDSSLYNFVQGGDKELSLEGMTVTDKLNTKHSVIEDLNNTNNIFNDTITLKQSDRITNISKSPNETYNVGTDIDQYNLNSAYDINGSCINTGGRPCYLSNRQGTTTVTTSVSQSDTIQNGEYPSEQAFAQMMSMETQIFAPDFIDSYKECFKLKDPLVPQSGWVSCSKPLPLLRRGDTIKYRITAINTGDDYAKDVFITDHLPPEVTLEDNSSIVSFVTPFNDPDANQTCSNSNYNYNQTVRDSCKLWLQDQVDGNVTQPYIIPDTMIDHSFNDINISGSKDTIVYSFPTFPKNHVAWMEFNTTVNHLAGLGNTIQNGIAITFTNPTLDDFNYTDSRQTQISLPVETSPITFRWQDINMTVTDVGKSTLRTKIVNEPFNLQITLHGISQYDINGSGGATVKLDGLRFVDIYKNHNATPTNITNIPLSHDFNSTIASDSVSWTIPNVSYGEASRAIFFDMNISIHDGNYTASKRYPQDSTFENDNTYNAFVASLSAIGINVNPSNSNLLDYNSTTSKYKTNFTGDVFSTRPASFKISLTGVPPSGSYTIVNAGEQNLSMNIIAPDISEVNQSLGYDANLSNDGTAITIGLDSNFSTNPTCLSAGDFNLTDANFVDGSASSSNIKYNEVGVIKILLKDSNWTYLDSTVGDCNATSGDNDSSDGLVSCNIDGNSSSIVFKPDHFTFTGTTIANHNNFTYMVENPITDPMFSTITTTVESRNADDNITTKFSNTCFADDVNLSVFYNATSKDLSTISLSMANDNNLTDITTDTNVSATDSMLSQAYKGDFTTGSSPITLRVAVDRNQTTPQQPLKIDAQDINGSIHNYLGIADANVSDANGTDINATNDLYFYYGRVHAPDYRFAGPSGSARVYYEVYCNDCNQTDRTTYTIGGGESSDSINWYINTLHTQIIDGNVSLYNSLDGVTFGASHTPTAQSTGVVNGVETILVTVPNSVSTGQPILPYKDKVEMNSTTWTTFNPNTFLLEFQDDQKDWAGQGQLGHIIDTNVSKRSNRRLDW